MIAENSFADLRRLADWLSTIGASSSTRPSLSIERIVRRLGTTCVPLLARELARADIRDVVRGALAYVATIDAAAKARVIDELRELASRPSFPDDAKLCAVGLLADLGAKGTARFADPSAIQKRSALALAAQLDSPSDLANAADMMVNELADDDLVQMLEVMVEVAPAAARRLADELLARLDLATEIRSRIASALEALADRPVDPAPRPRPPRPTHASVLVDSAARLVVVATRKVSGERRWRRWAVLIGPSGRIDDCIHEDDADGDASTLVDSLCADGYRVGSTDVDHARAVVAAAARLSGDAPDHEARLTSSYYTGRDLLDLGDAHLGDRVRPSTSALGHAVELLAEGHVERARALLGACDDSADAAAATAACLLAQDQPAAALDWLARAIAIEPEWPLHHWNQAVAFHRTGDVTGCFHALRRFIDTSATPTGLFADPDQPGRIASAERLLAELARTAKLKGVRLRRDRRRRRSD